MKLNDKLVTTKKREESGTLVSNRYSYQYHWALAKILEIFETSDDFALVMDYYDDVIILDSSSNPNFIDFYQIKTNSKANVHYISQKSLIERKKVDGEVKDSYLEKLIDNYMRFRNETKSLHFVSNKFFNLKISTAEDSRTKHNISLSELTIEEFTNIKDALCMKCGLVDCNENCKKLIFFDVSDLDINNYKETLLGKLIYFLNEYGDGTNTSTLAAYNTLITEIMRANNTERKPQNFSELLKYKSITKQQFKNYIEQFIESNSMYKKWSDVSNELRAEDFKTMEIKRIEKQWNKYCMDTLGNISNILGKIQKDIRKFISISPSFNTYKEYIEYVHSSIKDNDYYKSKMFQYEYYTAIILMELNYE